MKTWTEEHATETVTALCQYWCPRTLCGKIELQHSAGGGCEASPVVCSFLPLSAVLFPRLQGVLCAEPGVPAMLAGTGHGCTGQDISRT